MLDNDTQAALLARLSGSSAESEQGDSLETPDQTQNSEDRESQSRQTDTSEERVDTSSDDRVIPYDRFRRVNDAKKDFQNKYETQQKELVQLKKELESKHAKPDDDYDENWLDNLLKGEDEKPDNKYQGLEKRLRSFEMKEAEKELSTMVQSAQRGNRDLDAELIEAVVYQTIANDPNADVDDAIDTLRTFIDYAKGTGNKAEKVAQVERPVAAPRVSINGSKTYDPQSAQNKPKTLADAKESLYNFLKGK